MRAAVEIAVSAAMIGVCIDSARRWGLYLEQYGSSDYLLIALAGVVFLAAVYGFDRFAEEHGLLVHHWWED